MKVEEFEHYLTKDELANFKKLLKREERDYHAHVKLERADSVISRAFLWAGTDEGQNYWFEIQQRLRKGEPLTSSYMKGHQYMRFFTAEQWSNLCAIAMEFLGVKNYQKWMESVHVNITQFLGNGIPTGKQSQFMTNIRVADSSTYRVARGYQVKPGEFLTKVEIDRDTYTSTTKAYEIR